MSSENGDELVRPQRNLKRAFLYERDRHPRLRFLAQKALCVHEEHEQFIRPETLAEMREYEVIEFYQRERIRELSQKSLIHQELRWRIDELLRLRREHPEGSTQECICMDKITELISKLDLEDFRTLRIEGIIDDPNV